MKKKEEIKWGKVYWTLGCPFCEELDFRVFGKVKPKKRLYLECRNCKSEFYVLNAERFKIKAKRKVDAG